MSRREYHVHGRTHYDESEWSFMMSLIRHGFPYEHSAGRSLKCVARTHFAWTVLAPINKIHMKPRLMMAALIIPPQAKCFPRDGECTMLIHFPGSLRAR